MWGRGGANIRGKKCRNSCKRGGTKECFAAPCTTKQFGHGACRSEAQIPPGPSARGWKLMGFASFYTSGGGKWRQAEANRSHQENKQPNKEINNRQTQHFLNKQEEQSCQQTTTGRHISDKIAKRRSSVAKPGFRNGSVWFLRDDVWCGGWWEEGRCQSARLCWREVETGGS